jgi:hypothetical protein
VVPRVVTRPGVLRPADEVLARQLLAEVVLDQSNLKLRPGVDRGQVLAILARLLGRFPPPADAHGCLLLDALIPRLGRRPPEQDAVRRLLARGQSPTPGAVAGVARQATEAAAAQAVRVARLRPTVDTVGPEAAATVEKLWQRRRKPPTPRLLGRTLGWAKPNVDPMTQLLVEAGWLRLDGHRLTPGPRARRQDRRVGERAPRLACWGLGHTPGPGSDPPRSGSDRTGRVKAH